MKFDVVIANPPYNVGLLNRKITPICNTKNQIINKAAGIRIDAAFVVNIYENHLKENGFSIFVWPYSWTQLPSWNAFRNWIKTAGLKEIVAPNTKFGIEEAAVNVSVTVQQKGYIGDSVFFNPYRSSNPIKIKKEIDIIPNCIEEIGYEIFLKEQKFKHKLNLIYFKQFNKKNHDFFIFHATGYGLGDKATQISLAFKDLTPNTQNLIGPIKPEGFEVECTTGTMPIIIFDSAEHKERYKLFHNSKLYKFIIFQRKADFHNTKDNLGSIPDVCKEMIGEYTDEKAYKILGLTQEEIDHINKQF